MGTILGAAIAVLAVFYIGPLYAQDTTVPVGSLFGTIRPYIVELVGVVAAAIVAWLANLTRQKFNLDIEQRHRDALQKALENAAGLVISRVGDRVAAAKIDVGSPTIASAAKYVLDAVPDAIKAFGLTPQAVAEKVKAKLGQLA